MADALGARRVSKLHNRQRFRVRQHPGFHPKRTFVEGRSRPIAETALAHANPWEQPRSYVFEHPPMGAHESEVSTHTDRMIAWSAAYSGIPILTQWTTEEQADLPRLRSKLGGSGQLSPAQVDRLFGVLGNLRSENKHMSGGSKALLKYAEASGIKLELPKEKEILAEARRIYGACVAEPSRAPTRIAQSYDAAPRAQAR